MEVIILAGENIKNSLNAVPLTNIPAGKIFAFRVLKPSANIIFSSNNNCFSQRVGELNITVAILLP